MKNKKLLIIFIIIISFILVFFLLCFKSVKIKLELSNDNTYNYKEKIKYNYKGKVCLFNKCRDITDRIKVKDNINKNKIGTYKVVYELKYFFKKVRKVKRIRIVDKEKPIITLKNNDKITVCSNKIDSIVPEYEAYDNYDMDITDKVKVKILDSKIEYSVSDSSNNNTILYQDIIKITNTTPVIKLSNPNTEYIIKGSNKYNIKYEAYDECYGDLTDKVKVTNSVDINKVGTYNIKYSVKNDNNVETNIIKKVIVVNNQNVLDNINDLENYIKKYNVSVGYYSLYNDSSYFYKENEVYFGASLIKTLDALYIYDNNKVTEETRELVKKAISKSDNESHYKLLNIIGKDNLIKYGKSLGAYNTLSGGGVNGNTTVIDQFIYLKKLYNFINTNELGSELKSYFINSLGLYLDFNNSLTVMHKYGYYNNVYHDVGIVLNDRPYIIIVLTNEANNDYETIIKTISEKIYDINEYNTK